MAVPRPGHGRPRSLHGPSAASESCQFGPSPHPLPHLSTICGVTSKRLPHRTQPGSREDNGAMARGKLRIYLGAAPGVGKTYAMLSEAHRRAERGTDVVVGLVEHHRRPRTEALLRGLEVVPR
ncbi:hypothetical protein ACWGRV_40815, partial [Streptomyces sp. NPDC055663]